MVFGFILFIHVQLLYDNYLQQLQVPKCLVSYTHYASGKSKGAVHMILVPKYIVQIHVIIYISIFAEVNITNPTIAR